MSYTGTHALDLHTQGEVDADANLKLVSTIYINNQDVQTPPCH